MKYINIPKDRVGVLVGPDGSVRKRIEEDCKVRIQVGSGTGEVSIDDTDDPYLGMKAMDMVQAIGRGVSPENAFQLISDDVYFALFDIRDYTGKNQRRVNEIKGRVIGTHGKTRHNIEESTGAIVSVRGNTVALICNIDAFDVAKKALDMLLSGSEHSSVNKYLERSKSKIAYESMRVIE